MEKYINIKSVKEYITKFLKPIKDNYINTKIYYLAGENKIPCIFKDFIIYDTLKIFIQDSNGKLIDINTLYDIDLKEKIRKYQIQIHPSDFLYTRKNGPYCRYIEDIFVHIDKIINYMNKLLMEELINYKDKKTNIEYYPNSIYNGEIDIDDTLKIHIGIYYISGKNIYTIYINDRITDTKVLKLIEKYSFPKIEKNSAILYVPIKD